MAENESDLLKSLEAALDTQGLDDIEALLDSSVEIPALRQWLEEILQEKEQQQQQQQQPQPQPQPQHQHQQPQPQPQQQQAQAQPQA